jgi:polysaccharide export outer membrane protein
MNNAKDFHIFLVDDDLFSLTYQEQHIFNLGYERVSSFSNGTDCLNNLIQKPDVVFLDHEMADLNGFEVLKKIKRHNPDIFVVMVSGQSCLSVAVESLKYGAFDYIIKGDHATQKMEEVLERITSLRAEIKKKQSIWKRMMLSVSFLLWAFSLGGCTQNLFQQSKADIQTQQAELDSIFRYNPDYQYHIQKDDKITFSVWGQEELSVGSVYGIYNSNEVYGKWLLVDAEGKISVPKVGSLLVVGKTIPQLKDTLQRIFARWVQNPIVDAKVLNKEITVLGEVRNPATLQVDKDQNTLLEVIARTGGLEFYANLKYIRVFRQEGANVRVANLNLAKMGDYKAQNIQLRPRDIVLVSAKKSKVFDKRISVIIPFATTLTAIAIFQGIFK